MARGFAFGLAVLCGVVAAWSLGGCASAGGGGSSAADREIAEGTHRYPPRVEVVRTREVVGVRVSVPNPGWVVELDAAEPVPGGPAEVFVTARRPDPEAYYAMMVVTELVRTDLPAGSAVRVYVRVADHDEAEPGGAYRLAARSGG